MNQRIILNKYIVADPKICHGKPTFKGTRIMVWQVLQMLAAGESVESTQDAFMTRLSREQISAALDYASSITQKSNVLVNTDPVSA